MKLTCPTCKGSGEVDRIMAPVDLTPMQRRIYDIVVASEGGILGGDLVERVYAIKLSGAPRHARTSVKVAIHNANVRLAPAKQRIVSSRGWNPTYVVKTIAHTDTK